MPPFQPAEFHESFQTIGINLIHQTIYVRLVSPVTISFLNSASVSSFVVFVLGKYRVIGFKSQIDERT